MAKLTGHEQHIWCVHALTIAQIALDGLHAALPHHAVVQREYSELLRKVKLASRSIRRGKPLAAIAKKRLDNLANIVVPHIPCETSPIERIPYMWVVLFYTADILMHDCRINCRFDMPVGEGTPFNDLYLQFDTLNEAIYPFFPPSDEEGTDLYVLLATQYSDVDCAK